MHSRPGAWTRQEIYEALDKNGHAPKGKNPTNVIGNRLLDLEIRGQIVRVGRGAFEVSGSPDGSAEMGRNRLLLGSATQEAESDGT